MGLTAAMVSLKVGAVSTRELDKADIKHTFWTDSQIVLGYIAKETRRFKTFVANQVQILRDPSNVEEWKYITTNPNPTGDASHGIHVSTISKNSLWFKGPEFLRKFENEWPR